MTRTDATNRVLARLFVALASAALGFAAIEAASRHYVVRRADDDTFYRYASMTQLRARYDRLRSRAKWSIHPYLHFFPTQGIERGGNRHNSLGFRGDEIDLPKPPGRFRIACLGGSTTYTTRVDDYRASYPAQLQSILREDGLDVDVVNKWR